MSMRETGVIFAGCPDRRCPRMSMVKEFVISDRLRVHSAPKPSHSGVIMKLTKSVIRS